MENDFNTDPDSIDLLLKQAFLELDEHNLADLKLTEMLAISILNNKDVIHVDSLKEKELIQKISTIRACSFFTINKIWIISFLSISGLCILSFFYFTRSKNTNNKLISKEVQNIPQTERRPESSLNADTLKTENKTKDRTDSSTRSNKIFKNFSKAIDGKNKSIIIDDPKNFKYYQPKKCVILLPSYCCYCIPDNSKFATSIDSAGAEIDRIECESLFQMNNVDCIWITLLTKENSYLKLKDLLKNFAILKGKDKEVHPFAIKISNDPKIWLSDFKENTVVARYNKEINILLFFKDADAKVGSRVRINKFIATITK